MSILRVDAVSKSHGEVTALRAVSHSFAVGEVTAIIGRSGCGKSSLLRLCNGLERPDSGAVQLFGEPLDYAALPRLRRRMGYAVQGTGLFPHLNARDNISLLAVLEGWAPRAIEERLAELLQLMALDGDLLARFPHELSGGQQQRVGLCRAMMLRPEILLLDEPFAAIDPLTRIGIQQQLLDLHRQEPTTTLLVTHDMAEALLLADTILIMDAGAVLRCESRASLLAACQGTDPNRMLLAMMAGETA